MSTAALATHSNGNPGKWLSRSELALAAFAIGGVVVLFCVLYQIVAALELRIVEALAVRSAETTLELTFGTHVSRDGGGGVRAEAANAATENVARMDNIIALASNDGVWRRINHHGHMFRWVDRGNSQSFDDFQRWAWSELDQRIGVSPGVPKNWGATWRAESLGGEQVVRYFCPASVQNGRLQAALEIVVPTYPSRAFAAAQTDRTRTFLLAIGAIGISLLALLTLMATNAARRQRNLAAQFEQLSKVDVLTGIANRFSMTEAVRRLTEGPQAGEPFGLLLIDIDNFKNVNDSLGHLAGDEVLKTLARRLTSAIRESDHIFRYSGDEFVVVIKKVRSTKQLGAVARKLIDAVSPMMNVHSNDVFSTVSIGIACYPIDGADEQSLLKHADSAMYRAKDGGRNGYRFYSDEMNAAADEKLRMSSNLRHALVRSEFLLHYQPRFSANTRRILGFEALLRWNHPAEGLLSPDRFISHAEQSGAIEQLGEWVLRAALSQLQAWTAADQFRGAMAVNLSLRQLYDPEFPAKVRKALADKSIEPHRLELEVTESMVSHDPAAAAAILRDFRQMGVSIAIDDFGTGQSTFSSLLQFPINTVKIDRSFVAGLPDGVQESAIVRAIVSLGRNLDMRIVAEGVEHEAQCRFLEKEHCDELQGFHLGRPLPPSEAGKLLGPSVARKPVLVGVNPTAGEKLSTKHANQQ